MRRNGNFRYTEKMKLDIIKRDLRRARAKEVFDIGAGICTFVVFLAMVWMMCAL